MLPAAVDIKLGCPPITSDVFPSSVRAPFRLEPKCANTYRSRGVDEWPEKDEAIFPG
jgi:hypothetical protein